MRPMENQINKLKTNGEYMSQEADWRKIRVFFADLASASEYLSISERRYFLNFCYDLLLHRRKAVRRMAARTAGILLADLGPDLAQVWEEFLRKILFPVEQGDEQINYWLSYCLMQIMEQAASDLSAEDKKVFFRIYASYFRSTRWNKGACIILLSGILGISYDNWTPLQRHEIFGFVRRFLGEEWGSVITTSLLILKTWKDQGWIPQDDEIRYLCHLMLPQVTNYAQRYLMAVLTKGSESTIPVAEQIPVLQLMQENMHPDSDWALRLVHLDILKNRLKQPHSTPQLLVENRFQYANHLQDLLRMSPHPIVFMKAGEELLSMMPSLSPQQNYDICNNILKEIEMGVDSANSVASFLGRGFLFLDNQAQMEISLQLIALLDSTDATNAMTGLETVAIICASHKAGYGNDLSDAIYRKLLGFLSSGRYTFRRKIAAEASYLIRHHELEAEVSRFGPLEISHPVSSDGHPLAFFSASFDPVTNRDRAIIQELIDQGYRVCLSISDFDCNEPPQPYQVRKQMLQMALADMEYILLLSEEISIHLRNSKDLQKLRRLFPNREIWLVEESTQLESRGDEALSFPHIIYSSNAQQGYLNLQAMEAIVQGKVISLQLPAFYQQITAEDIRKKIQEGRSVSLYVDRQVQHMIHEWKLYLNKPSFRRRISRRKLVTNFRSVEDSATLFHLEYVSVEEADGNITYRGKVIWHAAGKTAVIDEIIGDRTETEDYRDLALMEFLAFCQSREFGHIVCFQASLYHSLLKSYGFLRMNDFEEGLTLDLSEVIVLFLDMESAVQERYAEDPRIHKVIRENQQKLRDMAARLYPGKLVLSFPIAILNDKLIRQISQAEQSDRADRICVPFGKMLMDMQIPDVITHSLNTEKFYRSDLAAFEIREFPAYKSLQGQIEQLHSFNRSIVLLDDLFHKGYRFEKISNLIRETSLVLDKVNVFVLSDKGTKLALEKNITVEPLYRIPKLKVWLLESDLCPFVGGDGIENSEEESNYARALCSINTILPYEYPPFLQDAAMKDVYDLSRLCLENTRRLYLALEEVYSKTQHHILTMDRIQEVMSQPRYPIGVLQEGSRKKKISDLLTDELKKLERLHV